MPSLFFAPHPDDEVIGAGALLAQMRAKGESAHIVVVTSGGAAGDPIQREAESRASAVALGISADVFEFWGYEDGRAPQNEAFQSRVRDVVARLQPSRLFLPAPTESHPDHRRVSRGVLLALTDVWRGSLWFYETTSAMPAVNCIQAAGDAWETKLAALACHASQLAIYDYQALVCAMGKLRGLAAGGEYAEGFLVFDWDGSPQSFFESTPILSVVVRASQPEYLEHALASLAAQDYDMLEVVLVWFGEAAPPVDAFPTLHIVCVAGEPNRARNLNIGVAAASGEFIAILDEDDVVDPPHYADLLGELRSNPRVDIAHSGTRLCRCRLDHGTVMVDATLSEFTEPVTPERLLLGNVLPIHAFACRTSLIRGYPFDEALGAYEDWDVLLRMAFDGRHFSQLDGVTAEYRLFGDIDLVERHRLRGFDLWAPIVQAKHLTKLQPAHLAALLNTQHRLQSELAAERTRSAATLGELERASAAVRKAQHCQSMLGRVASQLAVPMNTSDAATRTAALALSHRGPWISMVVPVFNTAPALLEEAIQSVLDQSYPNWTLCVVDDGSNDPATLATLRAISDALAQDDRVRIHFSSRNQGIVGASNLGVRLADSAWVGFLDHDDRLHPDALFEVALALLEHPDAKMAYTDSCMIDRAGALLNTLHKPDWSPTLLLSCNYVNHLMVIDRTLFEEIGGLNKQYEGAQDYWLVFECARRLAAMQVLHIPRAVYDWRAAESSVAYDVKQKPYAIAAAYRTVKDHLTVIGMAGASAMPNPRYPGISASWKPAPRPVHLIVTSRDNEQGLSRLLDALTENGEGNWMLTIVLTNAAEGYATQLQRQFLASPCISWVREDGPVNECRIFNRIARQSPAQALLFLRDCIAPTEKDWLPHLSRYLDLPGVGVVGAQVQYPSGAIAHLGVSLDPSQVSVDVTHTGARFERLLVRDVSAVRRTVMLVDREIFAAIGGFDDRLTLSQADVDFCLHARAHGARVVLCADAVWTLDASTHPVHDDSALEAERCLMRAKWPPSALTERLDSRYEVQRQATQILHVPRRA